MFKTSDGTQDVREGATVEVAEGYDVTRGEARRVYRYIVFADNDDPNELDLGNQNYNDTSKWQLVEKLRISILVPGESWMLIAPDGASYVLTLTDSGTLHVNRNTINAVSAAASVALGFSTGTLGAAISGAGAVAQNVILGGTEAYAQGSDMDSVGDVTISAASRTEINSTVVSLSVAVGVGSDVGVGASIGIGVARNFIGWVPGADSATPLKVHALLVDSSVRTDGALTLNSLAGQTIHSVVFAGSAAVAGGSKIGLAASGSGVFAENRIGVDVASVIDGTGSTQIVADSITLDARDNSFIHSLAGAASVAAAFGQVGAAISIGVGLARNTIDSQVQAAIEESDVDARAGNISITATDNAVINAVAFAASVGVGIGSSVGVGISGAGAWAENIITGGVDAHAADSDLKTTGAVTVQAENRSAIDAVIVAISAAVGVGVDTGGIGASIGVALARNLVGSTRDLGAAFDYQSADNVLTLRKGDTVRVESGVREGDVYEFLGDDVTVEFDYTSAQSPGVIKTGERVKRLAGGGFPETVFEYTGKLDLLNPSLSNGSQYSNEQLWRRVTAIDQDFANPDAWRLVNINRAPLLVLAYLENTSVDAGGALSVSATGNQSLTPSSSPARWRWPAACTSASQPAAPAPRPTTASRPT
jgi:hypothetical protein